MTRRPAAARPLGCRHVDQPRPLLPVLRETGAICRDLRLDRQNRPLERSWAANGEWRYREVMDPCSDGVVLDTNVFVAAGFNPRSDSARLLRAVRDGRIRMVWDHATRAEIEHIVRQIPPLSWTSIADLFREELKFRCATDAGAFGYVPDPADRKFAALADAAQVPLVTSDADLLDSRAHATIPVLKPGDFARRCRELLEDSHAAGSPAEPAPRPPRRRGARSSRPRAS
jgi:predicted nucleic acid-binding protein